MKILAVSDIHLEFCDYDLFNDCNADVLVLSGDIGIAEYLHDYPVNDKAWLTSDTKRGLAARHQRFLQSCSDRFNTVFYIAGNHEFYHGKFHAGIDYLRTACEPFSNIHFMEDDTHVVDDITFIGATLWTDGNKQDPVTEYQLSNNMSDYHVIRNDEKGFTRLRPSFTIRRHYDSLSYIKYQLSTIPLDKKVVVTTHHLPSFNSVHPDYQEDYYMNGGYCSDLSEFILNHPNIALWTCGHTHHSHRYYIGDTLVVCNPRGYQSYSNSESTGFSPMKVIDLNNLPTKQEVYHDYAWKTY